jgi:Zn-finger nucleic acid-binding protein
VTGRIEKFHSVEIDRCNGHGVWFDAAELETALVESSEKQSGTGSWLERLFGRAKQE